MLSDLPPTAALCLWPEAPSLPTQSQFHESFRNMASRKLRQSKQDLSVGYSVIFCSMHRKKKNSYKTELPKMAQQKENGTVTSSEEKTKLSWHKTGHPGPQKNYKSRKRLQESDGCRAGLERWGRGCGCHQV